MLILQVLLVFCYSILSINSQKSFYSSYYCIGAPWIYSDSTNNHCRFKNICYGNGSFYFYRHNNNTDIPLLYDETAKELYDFPDDFAYSDRMNNHMKIKSVYDNMNSYEILPPYEYILSINTNRLQINFGHHLWEFLMGVFDLISMFGLKKNDTKIVTFMDHEVGRHINLFTKYNITILETIKEPICFPTLVTGHYPTLNRLSHPREHPYIHNFYSFLTESDSNVIPKKAKITILQKFGRRNVANFDSMVSVIKYSFQNIDVEILDIAKLNGVEQVNALVNTTLLISPAGGISVAAPFLPFHSTLLVFGFFNAKKNRSHEYDAHQFAQFSHFSTVVFPITYSDVQIEDCNMDQSDPQIQSFGNFVYCDFKVNLSRLSNMIRTIVDNWYKYNIGEPYQQ